MGRRFYTTDLHGAFLPFKECLDKVNFNYDLDTLIYGGDIVDGWPQSKECIDLLMKIKNLVFILGNHDDWFIRYGKETLSKKLSHNEQLSWMMHGGTATLDSIQEKDIKYYTSFLDSIAKNYYITEDNLLFVHAGFDLEKPIHEHQQDYLIWDRFLVEKLYNYPDNEIITERINKHLIYNKVFLGHTPCSYFCGEKYSDILVLYNKFYLCDTGAAFHGKVTLINLDTLEKTQSTNVVKSYYPNYKGRNKQTFHQELFGF